jgi:predicted kinase
LLGELDRGAAELFHAQRQGDFVVQAGRRVVLDAALSPRRRRLRVEQVLLVNAERAQPFGARTFEELQVLA